MRHFLRLFRPFQASDPEGLQAPPLGMMIGSRGGNRAHPLGRPADEIDQDRIKIGDQLLVRKGVKRLLDKPVVRSEKLLGRDDPKRRAVGMEDVCRQVGMLFRTLRN